MSRLTSTHEDKAAQVQAVQLFFQLKKEILPEDAACSSQQRKKRSISCFEFKSRRLQTMNEAVNLVNTGLFTRDTLSALMQGNFSMVAMNMGLLATNQILTDSASALLAAGQSLTSSLTNAAGILSHSEIPLINKQLYLAYSMQIAAPFIKRGTSGFFAYQLMAHPNIPMATIVELDALSSFIEAAENLDLVTEGVSDFINPMAAAVETTIWIVYDIEQTIKQIQLIEQLTHLTPFEILVNSVYIFLHLGHSESITKKIRYNSLAKQAMIFLKNNTDFSRYVFSIGTPSKISLDTREFLLRHPLVLNLPEGANLFCLGDAQYSYYYSHPVHYPNSVNSLKTVFLCKNAIGVAYHVNRTGDKTIIEVAAKEESQANTFTNSSTLFIVTDGQKNYKGSLLDDSFIVEGSAITGRLDGNEGNDSVFLGYFNSDNAILLDQKGFLCKKIIDTSECDTGILLSNIERIKARENKEDNMY